MCVCWSLSSPDGSYTEEQSSETQVKVAVANTPEFDDEFDDGDEETLPTIGTCKAIYQFEGNTPLTGNTPIRDNNTGNVGWNIYLTI